MKALKVFCVSLLSVALLSGCKKDAQEDGIYFKVNATKAFTVDISISNQSGKELYDSDVKLDLTEPYTFSRTSAVKGRRLSALVETEGGTPIDAELKVKGQVIQPFSYSLHSTEFNGKSVREWDYIIK